MVPTHRCRRHARRSEVILPAEEIEQTALLVALEELDGSLDELRRLFAVEDDRARLALERLEEEGADLHRLDGMQARVGYRSIIVPLFQTCANLLYLTWTLRV